MTDKPKGFCHYCKKFALVGYFCMNCNGPRLLVPSDAPGSHNGDEHDPEAAERAKVNLGRKGG